MVSSLKLSMVRTAITERFEFVLRTSGSQLEYSARLVPGLAPSRDSLARHDAGTMDEGELGVLLERMSATDEDVGGELCTIQITTSDDEVHTTADFPVKHLMAETIVGRVYQRLRGTPYGKD